MDARITDSTLIALGGLIAVVALLFLLITKFRWHVFIAMLVPILLFALVPGIDHAVFITAFETGFGSTVRSVAVVIVVGIVLAEGLKHTGAVERITIALIRWVGEKRMSLALTLSGWVIGIPIFSDVGYVILNPLVHSAAIRSEVNMATMSTGLIGAMQLTHAMVPPTPGPLAAVALLKADMGSVIVWGCFVSIIASFFGWLYALAVGPRLPSPPSTEFIGQSFVEGWRRVETDFKMTLAVIARLFRGTASMKSMSGPLDIAKFSGEAARQGAIPLVALMAAISLQLGIFNLLPIPVLDGGHLFLLGVEGLVRRDFSLRVKERILQVGFLMILALLTVVLYNDVAKNLPARWWPF